MKIKRNSICIVAIAKNEERFIEEWILYHRMLGIDHFYIYDDEPDLPLGSLLAAYADFVTVINWHDQSARYDGKNNQTKAYTHALENYILAYYWVAFIDADEFIVLPAWGDNINKFLYDFDDAYAILLNWHVFGHNGYYEDPPGLVTTSLTRRMRKPSINFKSITRTHIILEVVSAHFCHIKFGIRVDANHRSYQKALYEGLTDRAHINHYQCRSFMDCFIFETETGIKLFAI